MTAVANLVGGCLCGAVRFSYQGALGGDMGAVTVCFCASCRKAQGLAAAVAPVRASGFDVTEGRELIREYQSSPGKWRAFCGACGSPLYSRKADLPDRLRLRLGALDAPPSDLRVDALIHMADRPDWVERMDKAPAYPKSEPGR